MRILGIDPGLGVTGYACLHLDDGAHEPSLVEAGVLRLTRGRSLGYRLEQLYDDLCELIEQLAPTRMVVESLFSNPQHARTSILMGHARGVVLLAGQRHGAELAELTATEVKKAVAGNGHATKHQIQCAVMAQFDLPSLPEPPDLADAIAVALCAARREAGARLLATE